LEALELGMAERGRLAAGVAGARVRLAEGLRFCPALEVGARAPHRVRGVEDVVLALGAPQQMEGDEARQLVQIALTAEPDVLEVLGRVLEDLEPVHGDVHASLPLLEPTRVFPTWFQEVWRRQCADRD